MSGEPRLEQRYRRVLRLLPGYYRERWEEDMVAAFLDSWLTGDADTDECVLEFCKPAWQEVASVILLAARLYLGGAGAPPRAKGPIRPRRHWRVVLTMVLLAAVAAVYRIASLGDYLQGHDLQHPHLINVGLAELLVLAAATALVAPDAARDQTAMPAPPPHPQPG